MNKPPTDLLVWHTIRYLGTKTDRLTWTQLRDYLVPNLLSLNELKGILKRGEDFGIINRRYYIDDEGKHKYSIELGSYSNVDPRQMDMFGSVILMTLSYNEGRPND